ncbi:MAG: protein-disulfide reductase DsbD family protein [Panacagrimonas sp.]
MIFRLLPAALLVIPSLAADAAPVQTDHVEAELIAENLGLQPGESDNWIALRLKPESGWHVYWQNPGDSGIPTKLEWTLPPGLSAGDIQWPYPHRHSLGDLTNYGYDQETLHLVPLKVAAGTDGDVTLAAKAKWLVCADICIPGEADLELALPVSDANPRADGRWTDAFRSAREQLPQPVATDGSVRYAIQDTTLSLAIGSASFARDAEIEFYPIANDLVAHAAKQRIAMEPGADLRLSQALSPYFVEARAPVKGVLVVRQGGATRAYSIEAQAGEVAIVPGSEEVIPGMQAVPEDPVVKAPVSDIENATLRSMLLFALLGGLILNLMPCVFPVLAMKALSVMHSRGESAASNRRHALAYTGGVIGSFVLVAGLLIALRAGGEALGWGFQLQSPGFVFGLTAVVFAMGLSLSGVAHFGSSWMGAGQDLASKPGLSGSFFTGVLAVVVASPCTAPFMAPALGFALAQPPISGLAVFAALGLGLALPFLLMGFVPGFARLLPKPGAWMETFKQVMAFPMYLTAVWLLWVLGGLTSRDGMGLALLGLVLVGFGVWVMGRARGGAGRVLAYAAILAAVSLAFHPALRVSTGETGKQVAAGWEPYSDSRLAQLRAEGRSVFVDFTADWCLTCKLNERGTLRSDRVKELFRSRDVVLLVGDWTRSDPAITAVLTRYGRSGVPLYLASSKGAEPQVLPQVLSPDIVVQAFQ